MASYAHIQTEGAVERFLISAARFFDRAASDYAAYRVYRTTLNELRALSDRELADLGMHRAGLKAIAAEAALKNTAQ